MLSYLANTPDGVATGSFITATIAFPSSQFPSDVTNHSCDIMYDLGFKRRVLLVLMHGYSETMTAITTATRQRFALLGFFVVVVDMRGRGTDTGSQDDSGREILDIADAVAKVRSLYPSLIHPSRNAICGWSGGGGNAEACLAKLPDLFTTFVSHYGISDYGYDRATSWQVQNPSYAALIETHVGGTFAAVPNWYRARYHTEAMPFQLAPNVSPGPRLYLFHDQDDVTVQVPLSDTVRDALNAVGLQDRFEYRRSLNTDAERYTHGYPDTQPGVLAAERYWTPRARNAEAWIIPPRGRVWVSGWIATKRFSLWFGDTVGGTHQGTKNAARVDYACGPNGGTFLVKPATADCSALVSDAAGRSADAACPLGAVTTVTLGSGA